MTGRFALAFTALSIVILVALEVPLGVNHANEVRDDLITQLQRDALTVGDAVEDMLEGADDADLAVPAVEAYEARTGTRVVIVDADGKVLADSTPPEEVGEAEGRSFSTRPEIAEALSGTSSSGERYSATVGDTLLYVAEPIRSGDRVLGAVRITKTSEQLHEEIGDYWRTLGVIGLVTLVTAAGMGMLLGRWVNQPLKELIATARQLGSGDLEARASTDHGPPEIQELAAQFNRTAERLGIALRSSQELAADAAHQLRTPLTALRLRLDNLADTDAEITAEDLDPLLDELERLDHTIDVLLALSRLEREPAGDQSADVAAIGRDRAELWQFAAEEQGATVEVDLPASLSASCNPNHLEQVLDNLLANAIAVSPPGSTVELRAVLTPEAVELHVTDHGPGMPATARARATERHWHHRDGGHGLGLAIVQRLCEHNEATLRLDETPGGGLDAVVLLQRAPAAGDGPSGAVSP